MSSVDVHTHCGYQLMLREAVAVVYAPCDNRKRYKYQYCIDSVLLALQYAYCSVAVDYCGACSLQHCSTLVVISPYFPRPSPLCTLRATSERGTLLFFCLCVDVVWLIVVLQYVRLWRPSGSTVKCHLCRHELISLEGKLFCLPIILDERLTPLHYHDVTR